MNLSHLKQVLLKPNAELGIEEGAYLLFWMNLPPHDDLTTCQPVVYAGSSNLANIEDAVIAYINLGKDGNDKPILAFTSSSEILLVQSYYFSDPNKQPSVVRSLGRISIDDWSNPRVGKGTWMKDAVSIIGEEDTWVDLKDLDQKDVRMNPSIAVEYELSKRLVESGDIFKFLSIKK